MRRGGVARGCLEDLLLDAGSPLRDWFRGDALELLVSRFDATGQGATGLWSLAVLGLWLNSQPRAGVTGAGHRPLEIRRPPTESHRAEVTA
jgi:uncharacterized protein (TIGR03382 family)